MWMGGTARARRARRAVLAFAVVASGAAACGRGSAGSGANGEASALVEAGGDVGLTADGTVTGEVTSGQYRRWLAAARALERAGGVKLPGGVRLRGFRPEDVDRLVRQIERDDRARSAITGAGMDVRQFVLLSVALERQMALATGPQRRTGSALPGEPAAVVVPPAAAPAPLPEPYPAPTPVPVEPAPPEPSPAPRDTARPAPVPPAPPAPPPDTVRRDTLRTT